MDWQQWLQQAAQYFEKDWGLVGSFSAKVALLYAYLWTMGMDPKITSGFRDPAKQKKMQEDWDAGRRAGLKFRPASHSDHTKGKAVDITTNNPNGAAQVARLIGIGTGIDYGDEVHFFEKGA